LPLEVNPTPKELKRVFVGRCDIITPSFEKELREAYKDTDNFYKKFSSHRYLPTFINLVNNK
jgi:hypothetical protein